MTDLLDIIEWSCVECLNQNPSRNIGNALKQGYREDDGLYLESDTDEQLLLHIPFNQAVKLHSWAIKSVGSKGHAPRKVRLFINRPSLGFSEAADFPAVQEFQLSEEDLEGKLLPLKLVKFQSVNILSIFIEDNQEEEETTQVQKIVLYGSTGETMNVNEIKKVGEENT
ncbi:DUF1000-domain-containing protein [Coccomyxa subellipsoidea C-169]|uniref:DUF1000-domain-containing protein n=1 Tax=Coccomyxa subellipsoidea (strain C-169) TaxID=574566 RepID=I0YMG8_COCSC|nr:DUF1000-domain-containing protein [Coccomyxa subellipsoidea C-169]EIE19587.1 DUF1000-domain-containing protein [Coccomyxa subellipsoidea C-169]|eukprot:XP_005644131.1 DUF1000-domain-containing protein [Coccomyxa subellipsoidea C-169]